MSGSNGCSSRRNQGDVRAPPLTARRRSACDALLAERSLGSLLERPSAEGAASGGLEEGLRRFWVAKHAAVVRTAPTAVSFKIGKVSPGETVIEIWSSQFFPGWVKVEPHGFMRAEDLSPAAPAEVMPDKRMSMSCRGHAEVVPAEVTCHKGLCNVSKEGSTSTGQRLSSQQSLLDSDSRLELMQLREANAQLQEQLSRIGTTGPEDIRLRCAKEQAELDRLRAECGNARADLQWYCDQRDRMKVKLELCSEVVSTFVASVDHHYGGPERVASSDEVAGNTDSLQEAPLDGLNHGEGISAAGNAIVQLLNIWDDDVKEQQVPAAAEVPAGQCNHVKLKENDSIFQGTKDSEDAAATGPARSERTRLQVLN